MRCSRLTSCSARWFSDISSVVWSCSRETPEAESARAHAVQRVPTRGSPLIFAEGLARDRTPGKMKISEQGEVRSTTSWRFIRSEIRHFVFTSAGRTCQLLSTPRLWQHDRCAGFLPHHTTLCTNQTQDDVYCACLADAANQCVAAHDPRSSPLACSPKLALFSPAD